MIKSGLARRVGAALFLAACSKSAPPAAAPPPPEVRIVVVTDQPIANAIELPGRLQAVRTSEVRARVDGIMQRRLYTEGTDVRAGQPLFEIDPRALRAQVNAAAAALAAPRPPLPTRAGRQALQGARRPAGAQPAGVRRRRRAAAHRGGRRRPAPRQLAAARLNLSYNVSLAPPNLRPRVARIRQHMLSGRRLCRPACSKSRARRHRQRHRDRWSEQREPRMLPTSRVGRRALVRSPWWQRRLTLRFPTRGRQFRERRRSRGG